MTVIIRTSGERTFRLCRKLILEEGVPQDNLHIICAKPFVKTLKKSFYRALQTRRKWTLMIDADVLLRTGAIEDILYEAEKSTKETFEIQGLVFDKFFGGARAAGNHCYRTEYLEIALRKISFRNELRPEAALLKEMKKLGYPYKQIFSILGVHDYFQSFDDIFRKNFYQAKKNKEVKEMLLKYWSLKNGNDPDFKYSLLGYLEGSLSKKHAFQSIDDPAIKAAIKFYKFTNQKKLSLNTFSTKKIKNLIAKQIWNPEFQKIYPEVYLNLNKNLINKEKTENLFKKIQLHYIYFKNLLYNKIKKI